MKSRQPNIYLWLAASLVGVISTIVIQPAWAEVKFENNTQVFLLEIVQATLRWQF